MHRGVDIGDDRRIGSSDELYHGLIHGAGTSDASDTNQYIKVLSIGEIKLKAKRNEIDAVLIQ